MWSVATKKIVTQLTKDLDDDLTSISISPDGQLIVVGGEDGEMKLFTYSDARLIHFETVHASPITSVCVSPDNTLILTADAAGQIFFWRI